MPQINRVPAGGYLGELALVTHKPRAASAYAVGDVKLACKFSINVNYFFFFSSSFQSKKN